MVKIYCKACRKHYKIKQIDKHNLTTKHQNNSLNIPECIFCHKKSWININGYCKNCNEKHLLNKFPGCELCKNSNVVTILDKLKTKQNKDQERNIFEEKHDIKKSLIEVNDAVELFGMELQILKKDIRNDKFIQN
jgi:RecJ-like exonuclease